MPICDGYESYHKLERDNPERFTVAGCWAHVKREFTEICKANAGSKKYLLAAKAEKKIQKIYQEDNIGVWGQRHLRYIKQNRKALYLNLLTSGKLNGYLADLDKQAEEMFHTLISQYKTAEGITEQLKSDNQMEWVGRMNNICQRATESVNDMLIYV